MNLLYSGASGEQKCLKNRGKSCQQLEKKGEGSEGKSAAALKNHSEAERRRRERINAHLTTLRGLVPAIDKMDKATLLAEVISHVKQLKKTATQDSEAFFIPLDSDELRVDHIYDKNKGDELFSFKASICCEYRPGILSDLRHAMDTLNLNLERSEISTLGDRVKIVFFFTSREGETVSSNGLENSQEMVMNSVLKALKPVMDKAAESAEFSTIFPSKRRRVSYLEYSTSSS